MRRISDVKKKKDYQKPEAKSTTQPVVQPTVDDRVVKTQLEATLALTEVAASAINNPQIEELLTALYEQRQKPSENKTGKRLTINRDDNGLIESIDIEEI